MLGRPTLASPDHLEPMGGDDCHRSLQNVPPAVESKRTTPNRWFPELGGFPLARTVRFFEMGCSKGMPGLFPLNQMCWKAFDFRPASSTRAGGIGAGRANGLRLYPGVRSRSLPESGRKVAFHDVLIFSDQS